MQRSSPEKNRRPRLLQVLYSGLGGHGSVAFSIVQSDKRRAYDHALVFFGVEPVRAEYENKCSQFDIAYSGVVKSRGADIGSFFGLYAALKQLRPDVILNHSPSAVVPVWLYASKASIPIITVEHQANAAKNWKHHVWSKVALLLSDVVVVLTEEYRREYMERHGGLARDVKVIQNGIDIGLYKPTVRPSRPVWRIGMASRLTPLRDHCGLVDALKAIAREDIELHIAGSGDTAEVIRRHIVDLDLSDRVYMRGLLDELQLVSFMQDLDIYVHASFYETMSTAMMQAMAVGLPVIAYDVPGIRNLVEHGVNGILVEPGNPTNLANAIMHLISDDKMRDKLGSNARHHACKHFGFEKMFGKYQALVETLRVCEEGHRGASLRTMR